MLSPASCTESTPTRVVNARTTTNLHARTTNLCARNYRKARRSYIWLYSMPPNWTLHLIQIVRGYVKKRPTLLAGCVALAGLLSCYFFLKLRRIVCNPHLTKEIYSTLIEQWKASSSIQYAKHISPPISHYDSRRT